MREFATESDRIKRCKELQDHIRVLPREKVAVGVTTANFRVPGAGSLADRLLTEQILPTLTQHPAATWKVL